MEYCLIGIDGNAYSLMGYTARALRKEGLGSLVKTMQEEATSSDYYHLICVCQKYIDMVNLKIQERI